MNIIKKQAEKDGSFIQFDVKDVPISYLNALRRAIIDYVPTLAIEDVELRQNNSILYDEVLAHRLGLLPITTEVGSYNFRVDGESGLGSEVKLTVDVTGPCTVYAKDVKSTDSKVKPAQDKMPIVRLLKGQELKLEATAILGRGTEHAKWSPGMLYYEYSADVKVNNKVADIKKFLPLYPSQVISGDKIDKDKIIELGLVDACEGVNKEIVDVSYDPSTVHVSVESWGQLQASTMVKEGCAYLNEALDEFANAIKDLK